MTYLRAICCVSISLTILALSGCASPSKSPITSPPGLDMGSSNQDGPCMDRCAKNAKMCSALGVQSCTVLPSGCTDWAPPVPCLYNQVCSGGQCIATCTNQCKAGAVRCAASGGVQTCLTMPSGCTDWGSAVNCAAGQVCSGGMCTNNCTNQCTAGATRCSGSQVQTCAAQPSHCTDWSDPTFCPSGQTCTGNNCVNPCGSCPSNQECLIGQSTPACVPLAYTKLNLAWTSPAFSDDVEGISPNNNPYSTPRPAVACTYNSDGTAKWLFVTAEDAAGKWDAEVTINQFDPTNLTASYDLSDPLSAVTVNLTSAGLTGAPDGAYNKVTPTAAASCTAKTQPGANSFGIDVLVTCNVSNASPNTSNVVSGVMSLEVFCPAYGN